MTVIIEARNLSFSYPGNIPAIDNVSLSIGRGEKVSILGPNGAGKTTLLLLMAGLREPTFGSILVQGKEINKNAPYDLRSKIGVVFQDPDDQIFMPTVEEDIGFGPANLGLPETEINERVREAIVATGLFGFEKRQPHHLSLGEKKRVALAGIIAMSPSIMLLDEPTSGLDPRGKLEMMRILERIGDTMVLVTHDVDLALEFSERTILLNKRVLFDGPTSDLFKKDDLLSTTGLMRPKISRIAQILKKKSILKEDRKPRSIEELEKFLE